MADLTEAGTAGLTAPTQTTSMMANDFPPPPPAPPAVEPPAAVVTPPAPQKFSRDIDLKDGSGVQHFEAESWEGLVDKLATAQENATRKIRELSTRPKLELERNVPQTRTPKQLSEADTIALKEAQNPVEVFNKLFEAQLGESPEQVRAKLSEFEAQKRRVEAEQWFLNKHKDDFYNCPENAQKINAYFAKEGVQVNKHNLEVAYQELSEVFAKAPGAVPTPQAILPPPPVPPSPITRDIPPPPVTIPANFGERAVPATEAGGVDAAEMAKIALLPPDQMKARIESLFRQQRGLAR